MRRSACITTAGPIKARNVIATLPGTKYPNEKIIVCGHLDSWDLATGATDNGLGSFAIVDMARTFKKLNLKTDRTIEFVLFMGEEQGLLGSRAYVADAIKKKTLDQVKYVFNFDMSANAIGFTAGGRKEAEAFFKATGEAIKAVDTVFTNKTSAGGSRIAQRPSAIHAAGYSYRYIGNQYSFRSFPLLSCGL